MDIRVQKDWSWKKIEAEIEKQNQDLYWEVIVGSAFCSFIPDLTLKVMTRDKKFEIFQVNFYPYDCMVSDAIYFIVDKMLKIHHQ